MVRGSVAGVGLNGFFKSGARIFQAPFGGVQHPQIVVGLGQLRVHFSQLAKGVDRAVVLTLLRQNHSF